MNTSSKSTRWTTPRQLALLLAMVVIPCLQSRAAVFGPYTPDANTVYLFHLNEPAGSYIATNAAGSLAAGTNAVAFDTLTGNTFPGINVHASTNFNILGQSPGAGTFLFGTFGTAANMGNTTQNSQTNGLGVDMNKDGGFTLDPGPTNSIAPTNDIVAIPGTTNFGAGTIFGANYSYTLEALINVSTTNGGAIQEIICSDDTQVSRGFQFRLQGPTINFNWIGGTPNANIVTPIPKTGDNAFVPNQWFHIAVTHTQVPVPGGTNTIIYWTHLNDTNLIANAILTNTVGAASNSPLMLVIGNEGRSAGSSLGSAEGLMGSIAEVRISNVQRGADQMMFYSPVITFLTQPANVFVHPGGSASFSVTEAGIPPLSNQWYSVSGGVTNGIPGATDTTLNIPTTGGVSVTNYFVIATNAVSPPATSSVATLTIRVPLNLTWAGTGGSTWDFTAPDWTVNNNASQTAYIQLDNATFDGLGAAQPAVNLTQTVTPDSVTVAGTPSYTISGVGSIAGPGWLTKNGSGTLTLTTTNTYSGPTTNSGGGTLQLGDGTATGTIGTNTVLNNAALAVNPGAGASVSFPAAISGSGSFTLNASSSSSAAVLSGSNSYSGATTVSSGSLHARAPSALGAGTTTVSAGAQLYVDANVDLNPQPLILNGSGIATDGALRKGGAGVTSFGGTITLGSDTVLNVDGGSTLNLTNSGGLTASSVANLTLAGTGVGNVTGPLTLGADSLTVSGGTWTLSSAVNNYSGKTFLNGGSLIVGAAAALGTAPGFLTPDQISLNGGTLGASASYALNDGLRGITVGASGGGFFVATNATLTVVNPIAGLFGGTITKSGNGTLVLADDSSGFIGSLNIDTAQAGNPGINDGITRIASPNALINITTIRIQNNNAGFSTLQLDGSAGALNVAPSGGVSWSGRNNNVPAVENVAGNNTFSASPLNWNVGGATYMFQSDADTLTVSCNFPDAAPPTGFRSAVFGGSGNILMSGSVSDGGAVTTNFYSIFKTGTGKLTLTGANNNSGTNFVSGGTMLVDNSIGTNTLTVVGGQVGGTGIINGATTIAFGGTLAPGDQAVGMLTINNNLTLAGGDVLIAVDKSLSPASSNSLTTVSGGVTNTGAGAVIVTNSGPALAVGNSFKLFNQPVVNGGAMAVIGGGVTWNNNLAVDGSISVASITIPIPVIKTISLNGTNLVLAGTNGPASGGFYVLSSTNVMLPRAGWSRMSTNVFGTGGSFNVTNAVAPGTPQSFFTIQLQLP